MNWLNSEERWPQHENKAWKDALKAARQAGWWFRPSNNHIFGDLRCSAPEPGQGNPCRIKVLRSGRAPDRPAKEALSTIRRCPHRAAIMDARTKQIRSLIDHAQGCIELAEAVQDLQSERTALEDDLAAAADFEEELSGLVERESALGTEGQRLHDTARSLGLDPETDLDVQRLCSIAQQSIDNVEEPLDDIRANSAEHKHWRQRRSKLQGRRDSLCSRMATP